MMWLVRTFKMNILVYHRFKVTYAFPFYPVSIESSSFSTAQYELTFPQKNFLNEILKIFCQFNCIFDLF